MGNGAIEKFMEKIGIDKTMLEIINHGHMTVHMAQHPETVKHNILLYAQWVDEWEKLSQETKDTETEFGYNPPPETPYAIDDNRFQPLGDNLLQYESKDGYYYIRDKKHEN
jgi:hypothetical protein